MLIAQALELHCSAIEPLRGPAVGAAEHDVAALEVRLGCRFPLAYREFLLWMGEDRKGLLHGTECFLGDVESNEQGLVDLLCENDLPPPLDRPVVFFLHQGYLACWFCTSDTAEDPEVFSFNEGLSEAGIRSLGRFSRWLYVELSGLVGERPEGDDISR
ncbi:MAG: SMI1/KNR4 family protein [Pseudomonas sp.]|uniref:SMI1/KNR4 family protein n=1 Tax=Pseudomonas sp. TaxID=306 RepID=UPI0033949FB1